MPFPNFHAARVRRPGDFLRIVVLKTLDNGIMIYGGPLKSDPSGSAQTQAYRFPKDKFTVGQARKWLKDHDIKTILFERASEKVTEAKHSHDRCMHCEKSPLYEVLWANGYGHAWFCESDLKKWATNGDGFGEILYAKEVVDKIASKKFSENRNPNIWEQIRKKFKLKESVTFHYIPGNSSDDQLYNCWRIIGNWILSETQKDNKFKGDEILNKYAIPTLKEFLKRGKKEFCSESWDGSVKELFLQAFNSVVKKYMQLDNGIVESIISGGIDSITLDKKCLVGNFYLLIGEDQEVGFIRLSQPDKIIESENYRYMIRDFIVIDEPRAIEKIDDDKIFGNRDCLKECIDKFKDMTDEQIIESYNKIQDSMKIADNLENDSEIIEQYIDIMREIKKRKLEFQYKESIGDISYLDVNDLSFPIKLKMEDQMYELKKTSSGKLVLNK